MNGPRENRELRKLKKFVTEGINGVLTISTNSIFGRYKIIRYMELKVIELNATWIEGENKKLGKYLWANFAGLVRMMTLLTDR